MGVCKKCGCHYQGGYEFCSDACREAYNEAKEAQEEAINEQKRLRRAQEKANEFEESKIACLECGNRLPPDDMICKRIYRAVKTNYYDSYKVSTEYLITEKDSFYFCSQKCLREYLQNEGPKNFDNKAEIVALVYAQNNLDNRQKAMEEAKEKRKAKKERHIKEQERAKAELNERIKKEKKEERVKILKTIGRYLPVVIFLGFFFPFFPFHANKILAWIISGAFIITSIKAFINFIRCDLRYNYCYKKIWVSLCFQILEGCLLSIMYHRWEISSNSNIHFFSFLAYFIVMFIHIKKMFT